MTGNKPPPEARAGMVGPLIVLVALLVAFAAYVTMTLHASPVQFATHFDGEGVPNDWMSRGGYRTFILGFGFGVSVFMVALFWVIAKLGGRGLNVPNKDYWLAPERREAALQFIRRQGVWMACIQVGFIAALNRLILVANEAVPPRLPASELTAIVVGFLAATGIWVFVFLRRFRRPPNEPAP